MSTEIITEEPLGETAEERSRRDIYDATGQLGVVIRWGSAWRAWDMAGRLLGIFETRAEAIAAIVGQEPGR